HQVQAAPPQQDPVLQASVAPLLLPRTSTNFDGIGLGFLGVNTRPFEVNGVPPDPQGDVGPSHYVQIVNASFAVFGKDGRCSDRSPPGRSSRASGAHAKSAATAMASSSTIRSPIGG